jgi:ubiquinone/menaquinone biosynthesis C-methylase UbiE
MKRVSAALGRQLAHPHGLGGRIVSQAMRLANRRPTRLAITALGIRPTDSVLDLGCGPGDAIPQLLAAAPDGAVHGLDHAPEMLIIAKQRYPAAAFHQGSFTALPFAARSFDRVLATNVAYFWQDHETVLGELRRILRPGGRLAVYVSEQAMLRRIGLADTGTHRLFTRDQLHQMLGPTANVVDVQVGPGVKGMIGTIDL